MLYLYGRYWPKEVKWKLDGYYHRAILIDNNKYTQHMSIDGNCWISYDETYELPELSKWLAIQINVSAFNEAVFNEQLCHLIK